MDANGDDFAIVKGAHKMEPSRQTLDLFHPPEADFLVPSGRLTQCDRKTTMVK